MHLEFRNPPGVVLLRLAGRVSSADAVLLLEALRRYPPSVPVLADCRRMAAPSAQDVEEIAQNLTPPHPYNLPVHAVVVVTPELRSAVRALLDLHFPGPRVRVHHVCHSWDEAIHALGIGQGALPDWESRD